MKTSSRKIRKTAAVFTAAAISFAASSNDIRSPVEANAEDYSHYGSTTATGRVEKIVLAPADIDRRTVENFRGKDVRGSAGNYLGNVADVVVDTQSGRIALFVVSSGGVAGIGDTLRLVPYGVMHRATNDDGFTVAGTDGQWEELPMISEEDFEAGRINITLDQQRRLADVHDSSPAQPGARNRPDFGQRLARAERLEQARGNHGLDVFIPIVHEEKLGPISFSSPRRPPPSTDNAAWQLTTIRQILMGQRKANLRVAVGRCTRNPDAHA